MSTPLLATKLYIPLLRSKIVLRPYLIGQLNEGTHRKLTLISAPAGFGKTTLVSEWAASAGQPVAWLSLDEGDNDPARFLIYLISALQTIDPDIGKDLLGALNAPQGQAPSTESVLTELLNDIAHIPTRLVLVLDDYHVIDSKPVDEALAFLLKHLPARMHLVIATREDPPLPLAKLRARDQLTELRASDLRFTPSEAADFLNQVMGLNLSAEDIAALETRTEGWIAGLQLAAISMQGYEDVSGFIRSFTGSHHFVLDYLIEEVLHRQPETIQTFLLRTSILDRLCGPLCDAVLGTPSASGQETLEYLERANLFIVPLDNERRWFRYHHLFGDLLRQRLNLSLNTEEIADHHIRGSEWYEQNGMLFDAFRHATAAGDVERAERLIENPRIGLHIRSVAMVVLAWLASLPKAVLDAHPRLWVRSGTLALMAGQTTDVEEKLQSAEKALQDAELNATTRDLIGQIACARATLALTRYDPATMLVQAHRALEYLHPDNLTYQFTANWALASAYLFQGNRAESARAYTKALSISQASGNTFSIILALNGLGKLQEFDNQLYTAAETYRRCLDLFGDHPQPNGSETILGLARIHYEWNDLDAAEEYALQSLRLARQFDRSIDRYIVSDVLLAQLKMVRGDLSGAAILLAQSRKAVHPQSMMQIMPLVTAAQVLVLLKQGNLAEAAELAQTFPLPLSQARILLAREDPSAALAVLLPFRQQMEAMGWADERLKAMVLEALALHQIGEKDKALQLLGDILTLTEPGGFVRTFVDEGVPMAQLLSDAAAIGLMPDSIRKLLAVFEADKHKNEVKPERPSGLLGEPLSQRELEILKLIAQGLSNQEICKNLFLALDTVKGHNRKIFAKLQVQRRTEAIVRARELNLL